MFKFFAMSLWGETQTLGRDLKDRLYGTATGLREVLLALVSTAFNIVTVPWHVACWIGRLARNTVAAVSYAMGSLFR